MFLRQKEPIEKCSYLGSLDADDAVRVARAVVIERHVDGLRARRQPFLLRVRVDLEDVCFRCENGLLPANRPNRL